MRRLETGLVSILRKMTEKLKNVVTAVKSIFPYTLLIKQYTVFSYESKLEKVIEL